MIFQRRRKKKNPIEYVVDTDFQLDCSKGFCFILFSFVLVKLLIVSLSFPRGSDITSCCGRTGAS